MWSNQEFGGQGGHYQVENISLIISVPIKWCVSGGSGLLSCTRGCRLQPHHAWWGGGSRISMLGRGATCDIIISRSPFLDGDEAASENNSKYVLSLSWQLGLKVCFQAFHFDWSNIVGLLLMGRHSEGEAEDDPALGLWNCEVEPNVISFLLCVAFSLVIYCFLLCINCGNYYITTGKASGSVIWKENSQKYIIDTLYLIYYNIGYGLVSTKQHKLRPDINRSCLSLVTS